MLVEIRHTADQKGIGHHGHSLLVPFVIIGRLEQKRLPEQDRRAQLRMGQEQVGIQAELAELAVEGFAAGPLHRLQSHKQQLHAQVASDMMPAAGFGAV
ncbi:hypothetical protein D3C76_1693600 [compost metagenome]